MKNLQTAQENAVKVSRQERFAWEFAGVSTMVLVLLIAGGATKRKDFAVPIAPLVMGLGYRYFCAFGESSGEIRDAAESLLKKKDDRLRMPGGPLTLTEIDAYRERHFQ
ncbi:unnamed protein product [Heligmosomoides polygyrus]|uniref:Uncharacterized protein n=1 Tax=Heligmosomoides polygyrus TaxID=6339 RepID=A0A3P8AI79_HELPZ|nr:unnamed protein product [Heligmosomoides polygyrus]